MHNLVGGWKVAIISIYQYINNNMLLFSLRTIHPTQNIISCEEKS